MKGRMNIARSTRLATLVAGIVLAFPSLVLAQRIFVNGVEVTHANMRNTQLDRVDSVTFDAQGNLLIVAPTYNIQVVPPSTAGGAGAPPVSSTPSSASATTQAPGQSAAQTQARNAAQGTYVMTISNPNPGSVPYEIDIVINGKHVATWGSHRANSALDITSWMQRGRNVVTFQARRTPGAPTTAASNELRIALGEGTIGSGNASVTRILAGQIFRGSDTEPTRSQSVDFEITR